MLHTSEFLHNGDCHPPNGWWRDNAQKELIARNDLSVLPALKALFQKNGGPLDFGSLHALWTIDGLGKMDKEIVLAALDNSSRHIRKAGIRLSEKYILK